MELSLYIKDKLVSGKRVAIPIMTHPGIELLGKQVSDAVTNGEIHYHAIRALNECFPQSAACTTIMDLTVEAEAFGARLSMSPNEVPSVCGRLLTGYADVEALQIPSVESGRMPQYLLADRLAAEGIDKPVLAGCIGPYSLAGRLYDMTEIMMAIYTCFYWRNARNSFSVIVWLSKRPEWPVLLWRNRLPDFFRMKIVNAILRSM